MVSTRRIVDFFSTKRGRLLGLAILPACYLLGFLLWSYYAAIERLGFLPLTSPRYLTAGAILLAYLALVFVLPIWFVNKEHRKKKGRALVQVLLITLCNLAAVFLFMGLGTGFHVFELDQSTTWLMVALPIAIVPLVWFVQILLLASVGAGHVFDWVWEFAANRRASRLKKIEGAPFLETYRLTWALILFVAAGNFLLPAMESEFGGANPRVARLELVPGVFSNAMLAALGVAENSTQTDNVTVMFYDDASLVVRVGAGSGRYAPLYELDRSWVVAIIWRN